MPNGTQLFLDNCQRADENPLSDGGVWSLISGFSNLKLASNLIEPTATSTNCAMRVSNWASLGGGEDQYVEIVLNANLANTEFIHIYLRCDSNRQNCYLMQLTSNANIPKIIKFVSNVQTTLLSFGSMNCQAGDRIRLTVIGSQITLSKNFQILGSVHDASVPAGGLPGLLCFSSASLTAGAISYYAAGFPSGVTSGVWTKKGIVLAPNTSDLNGGALFCGISNQTAMYDTNPQLISANPDGRVFKMWFMGGNSIYYAESQTALPGSWTRRGTAVMTGVGLPRVYKDGSTYYAYVSHAPTTWTHVDAYTSSDGITWTLAQLDIIVSGGSGYDQTQAAYFSVIGNIGGTWYALYAAESTSLVFSTALATAPALLGPWTKSPSNPVLTNSGCPEHMVQIGGYWYGWLAQATQGSANTIRMRTADFITWDSKVIAIQPEQTFEGLNQSKALNTQGEVSVPTVLEANGSSYMFYDSGTADNTPSFGYLVNVATAPYTLAQLVALGEEYFITQPAGFSDSFNRADGGLGANYSTPSPHSAYQIVSNKCEPSATVSTCRANYVGSVPSISNNQFAEITVPVLNAPGGSSAFANPLCNSASGAATFYGLTVAGATGANHNLSISRTVAGSATVLGPILSALVSVGDVYRLTRRVDNGVPLLSAYQNGNLILEVYDYGATAIASGAPGFDGAVPAAGTVADAQISLFRTGESQAPVPPVPGSGSAAGLSMSLGLKF